MNDTVTLLVGVLTAVTLILGLVGMAMKFVALPWLKEHIAAPVQETQRQVTVNKHVSNPPTLLDKVDHVSRDLAVVQSDLTAAAEMFEGHMDHSAEDRQNLWRAIAELRKELHP